MTPPKSPRQHHLRSDEHSIERSLKNHLTYTGGKTVSSATGRDWFDTTAHTVRDHLIERWVETVETYNQKDPKRLYYLSLEFLIGRTLSNAAHNLDIEPQVRDELEMTMALTGCRTLPEVGADKVLVSN